MKNYPDLPPENYFRMDLMRVKFYEGFVELFEDRVSQKDCPATFITTYSEIVEQTFRVLVSLYKNENISGEGLSNGMFKIKRKVYVAFTCFTEKILSLL